MTLKSLIVIFFFVFMPVSSDKAWGEEKAPTGGDAVAKGGRFLAYEDGTVLDSKTGLMWPQNANLIDYPLPFRLAKRYIQDMNSGKGRDFGYADWRMPAISELETLIDKSKSHPAMPDGHPFKNLQNRFYWSSSLGRDITEYAWVLDMSSGTRAAVQISNCTFMYFLPVRNGRASADTKAGMLIVKGMPDMERPTVAESYTDFIKVAAGMEHVLALKSDGTVWAWGRNDDGRIGDGTVIDKDLPVQVENLNGVIDIAAGTYHSVALKSDGAVWAWGRNSYGQLGDGSTTNSLTPVRVKNLSKAEKIYAGFYSTFAVRGKTLWAWGGNSYGQLGDASNVDRQTPVEIKGVGDVEKIASGMYHTVALRKDGTLWAWGWNTYGLIGDGTREDRIIPIKVEGFSDIKDIAVGLYHSIALRSDGTVWAWGKNEYGQLGISRTGATTPVMVENLSGARAVSAGPYHSVSLMEDGTVRIWGKDGKERVEKSFPTEARELAGAFYVSAGKYFTVAIKN